MTPGLSAIVERLEKIEERLEKVEKQIADANLVRDETRPGRTIVAQNFLVTDTQGVRRAELGIVKPEGQAGERPWLGLFDANENLRVGLGTTGRGAEGPWLEFYDEKSRVVVEVSVNEDGPTVRLFDANGEPTVAAETSSKYGPCVALFNPNGKQRVGIGISSSGTPSLVIEDANGDKVLKLAVESDGPSPPPVATDIQPGIATLAELAEPWSAKPFFFQNRLSGANVPALIVRLPGGSASSPSAYWAFSLQVPFGRCQLEYLTDLQKLATDYGFRAKHPMVGDPCSRTIFDPLRMASHPGNVWVRGAIVQGSDLRPPYGIELQIAGKEISAVRME